MSSMLNQRQALAKLRAELEGREGRMRKHCGRFRHLAQMCRNGKVGQEEVKSQNQFKVLRN